MIFERLPRKKHIRKDGWLCELVSMNYSDEPFSDVHSYLVFITPDMTRANHYHKEKHEWIAPASGIIEIRLENVETAEKEIIIINSKHSDYSIIHVPPFVAHSIKNIGNAEACIVVFSKNAMDKTDTIPYEVAT